MFLINLFKFINLTLLTNLKINFHKTNLEATVTDEISSSTIEGERIYSEICSNCSSTHLVKNGTCKVCQDCGTTTGCS